MCNSSYAGIKIRTQKKCYDSTTTERDQKVLVNQHLIKKKKI